LQAHWDAKTNIGFSVGGGMEGRFCYWLPPNWTWKLEYLYLDLGSIDTTTPAGKLMFQVCGAFVISRGHSNGKTKTGTNHDRFGI
jgi:opacity protein-like surface antigen